MDLEQRPSCIFFDRLTGKTKPKLEHPTAKAFRLRDWILSMDPDAMSIPDAELLLAAGFFGNELVELRDGIFPHLFDDLSCSDVVRLAVGSSNRAVALSKIQLTQQLTALPKREAGHLTTIGETQLATAHGTMSATDISTAVVDSLPHWFAQAKSRIGAAIPAKDGSQSLMQIHARAETFITIERAIRDLWQQILWEPWRFDPKARTLAPYDRQQAANWTAWQHRQDSLTTQFVQFDSVIDLRHDKEPPTLKRVPRSAQRQSGRIKISMGFPTAQMRDELYKLMELVTKSYLGPFLDASLPGRNETVRDMVKAWLLLRVLGQALVSGQSSLEFDNRSDLKALSFELPAKIINGVLADGLGISSAAAEQMAGLFTCDPMDLKDVFANELWHRPLVQIPETGNIAVATSVLQSGNLIFVLGRLFKATGLDKQIENRSLGLAYERSVRTKLADAVGKNAMLRDASVAPSVLEKQSEGDEEIDVVIRIGRLIVVGEVKCFLRPTDPVDRYNHINHLQSAARQAERKMKWLQKNTETLKLCLADPELDVDGLNYLPVVILNEGTGVGVKLGEALVTDAHWLSIVLGGNRYGSGGEKDNRTGVFTQRFTTLYSSNAELESKLPLLLLKPPGLEKFKNAITWDTFDFPTSSGGSIQIERARLSNERMVQAERHRWP